MPDAKSAKPCVCGRGPTLIFACSGASDVGEITDLAARALVRGRNGFMCCVAAIAAGIEDIVEKARGASRLVVIDGCSSDCARLIMERGGFSEFIYLQLEDIGMKKGSCPLSDARIAEVVARVRAQLEEARSARK